MIESLTLQAQEDSLSKLKMMNIDDALKYGIKILERNSIKSAKLDEIIISKIMGKDRGFILLNQNKYLENKQFDDFKSLIVQRSKENLLLI